MFEYHHQPLLSRRQFIRRLIRYWAVAVGIIGGSLLMGMIGYRALEGLSWIDALLNSAMLLGGMGPVAHMQTTGGKLFASFYALYSGLIFLIVASILIAPVAHRIIHRFHLVAEEDREEMSL